MKPEAKRPVEGFYDQPGKIVNALRFEAGLLFKLQDRYGYDIVPLWGDRPDRSRLEVSALKQKPSVAFPVCNGDRDRNLHPQTES